MTKGCRWQEKRFSVAVSNGHTLSLCDGCKTLNLSVIYKYNGDNLCRTCFSKKPSKGFGSFNTHKDLGYTFTTDMFDGKPVEVRSRRHYKNLLKQAGMADASMKECRQEAEFRKRINQEDYKRGRKKTAERMFSENRDLLKLRVSKGDERRWKMKMAARV